MLTHLLATDPATPAGVLTYLAGRAQTARAVLDVAAHPNLPADAPVTVPPLTGKELHTALTHPGLPAHRRRQFIDAAKNIAAAVRTDDDFTPAELAHIATYPQSARLQTALARNPHTPLEVARDLIEWLYRAGRDTDILAADVLTLRHGLAPTTPQARSAAATPDPLATYAQQLLTSPPQGLWWAPAIYIFPHPLITAAALARAADPATSDADNDIVCFEIATNSWALPDHRYRAAALTPWLLDEIADDLPDAVLADLQSRAPIAAGWNNARATDTTLRAILNHKSWATVPASGQAALALHPAASAHLRTDVLAASSTVPAWLAPLVHHLNTRGTVLDAPLADLTAAASTLHAHHWARAAWSQARTAHPAATLTHAQVLLALEAAHFAGTLRELLASAHTVST